MSTDDVELIRGSGNVFRDFGHPDADILQAKAVIAARIIGALDDRDWTVREAEKAISVAHTDLSRIRNVKLDRFTLDRLIIVLGKLDTEVEICIDVKPRCQDSD
ncbi:MAG: hypothetical protein QOJ86_5022 [Bradyrhizobium sp.]|jgi:predicted XRE-type DNA-binding protein|nr:hypothetical protein [Bradyrhizobium sp.]